MIKKVLSLLTVVIIITVLYSCQHQDSNQYSDELEFTLNQNGESYSLTGIGDCKDTHITIPSTYKDYPVTSIGEKAFWNADLLISLTIPDTITSIGDKAFSNCNLLTSVTIPDSVTSIGDAIFSYCDSH